MVKIKYPCCNGVGKIDAPCKKKRERLSAIKGRVKLLKKQGFSYREIMAQLGISSTSMVNYYLTN